MPQILSEESFTGNNCFKMLPSIRLVKRRYFNSKPKFLVQQYYTTRLHKCTKIVHAFVIYRPYCTFSQQKSYKKLNMNPIKSGFIQNSSRSFSLFAEALLMMYLWSLCGHSEVLFIPSYNLVFRNKKFLLPNVSVKTFLSFFARKPYF